MDCCIGEDAGKTLAGRPETGYGRNVVEIGREANTDAGRSRVAAIPKVASMCTGFEHASVQQPLSRDHGDLDEIIEVLGGARKGWRWCFPRSGWVLMEPYTKPRQPEAAMSFHSADDFFGADEYSCCQGLMKTFRRLASASAAGAP